MSNELRTAVAGALYAAALAAPLAVPNAADAAGPGGAEARAELREVVVTAQRREEQLVDVPIAVQAFRGEDLERTGVRDFNDVIRMIPGASEGRSNTGATKTYQIRGVSSYYGEPTIGYYLDEAAFSVPNRNYAPVVSAFDLDRVEALRGPQGTLYGLGSMGGAVRFITAEPDLEAVHGKAQVGYSDTKGGDTNHYVDGALSLPVVTGKLGVRFVGSTQEFGGFAESPSFPDDLNSIGQDNYRVKALYRPGEAWTFKVGYQRTKLEDHWGRNLAVADPPGYPASAVPGRNEATYDMYTGFASYAGSAATVELAGGYIERADDGLIPLNGGVLTVRGRSDMYTQELRLISRSGGALEWVVGGIYQDGRNTEAALLRLPRLPPPAPPLPATLRDDVSVYETKSYAVYGELAWNLLGGRLKPLVGLRYFADDREFTNSDRTPIPPFGPPPAAPRLSSGSDTFTSTNPRVNVSYKLRDDALVYLNVAKGFRSGTFNTAAGIRAAQQIGITVGPTVDPDSLWSYEIGTKFEAFARTLIAEFAVYRFDWKDQQLNFDAGASRTQVIVNAGDTVGQGFEYGLTWLTPLDGLTLAAAGNVNSTEFDEIYNPALFVATPNIVEGRQVASVPKQTHSLAVTYRKPLAWSGVSAYLNLGYTHVAKQGDPGDSGAPPLIAGGRMGEPHDLVKARLGVEAERWSVYVFGDNLLDDADPIMVSGSGVTRYYPRVVGVELRVGF